MCPKIAGQKVGKEMADQAGMVVRIYLPVLLS